MAIVHLDNLVEDLIETGIFADAKKIEHGIWERKIDTNRIHNQDETP